MIALLQAPLYRLQMADLGERYQHLQGAERLSNARPQRVAAKEDMFAWLHGDQPRKGQLWDNFTRETKYWKRWMKVTEILSRGVVALFPSTMRKTFVEQTLKVNELTIWLEGVARFRPEVLTLSAAIHPIITAAIAGLPPPTERLRIEAWDGSSRTLGLLGTDWFGQEGFVPQTPPSTGRGVEERGDEPDWDDLCTFSEIDGDDL